MHYKVCDFLHGNCGGVAAVFLLLQYVFEVSDRRVAYVIVNLACFHDYNELINLARNYLDSKGCAGACAWIFEQKNFQLSLVLAKISFT